MTTDIPGSAPGLSRKKKIIRMGAAGLIVLVLVFSIPHFIHSLSHESTDDAFIDGKIISVSPRVAGHVIKVYATDNRWVKAGDLLVELDPGDFDARLNAAKAALESAKAADQARNIEVELTQITATAELDEARSSMEASKAAVQEVMARLAMAKAALDQIRAEADSANARHQMVSPQDLDHAKVAEHITAAGLTAVQKRIEIQKAAVQEADAALKAAEARLHQADARLVMAQAAPQRIQQSRFQADVSGSNMDKAEAEMIQARLSLSYTKILAPCDGVVAKKGVEPGQFVQTGQSLLAIVPREVWVTANFKETQIKRMKPGQPVEITVDTYPDIAFHGHVDSIQRGTGARFSLLPPENATGNYVKVVQRVPVKIVFDPQKDAPPVLLTPGMSVVPDVNVGDSGWPEDAPDNNPLPPGNKGAKETT
ncbi:MAG: HlyD family secretion protein [Proteobacteria bacterium]|nr:HlyD family secretion protein [Pseudomonadota bacterium]